MANAMIYGLTPSVTNAVKELLGLSENATPAMARDQSSSVIVTQTQPGDVEMSLTKERENDVELDETDKLNDDINNDETLPTRGTVSAE